MHQTPKELFTVVTKAAHFKVATALYQLADSKGEVRISTGELAAFCGVSESTLTRAFRDLESKGYLETRRSRKGFNRFSFNIYTVKLEKPNQTQTPLRENGLWVSAPTQQLTSPAEVTKTVAPTLSDGVVNDELFPSLTKERSTAVTVTSKSIDSQVSKKGKEILRISIPTGKPVEKRKSESKEILQGTSYKLSMDPKDFRTRGRRPVETWTTWDVAAEFADRLQKKYPTKPLLINKKRLAEALRPMRKNYGSTPEAELWIIKFFFMDPQRARIAETAPSKVVGTFLNLFKTDLEKALSMSRQPKNDEFVYASDGREFDNSMRGRLKRDEYEATLVSVGALESLVKPDSPSRAETRYL